MITNWNEMRKDQFLFILEDLKKKELPKDVVYELQFPYLWREGRYGSLFLGYIKDIDYGKVRELAVNIDTLKHIYTSLHGYILTVTNAGGVVYPIGRSSTFNKFLDLFFGNPKLEKESLSAFFYKYKSWNFTAERILIDKDILPKEIEEIISEVRQMGTEYVKYRTWDISSFNTYLKEVNRDSISKTLENYRDVIIGEDKNYEM